MNSEIMEVDIVDYNEAFKITNIYDFKINNLCDKCNKLLNIPPIYCLQTEEENKKTVVVCGRCLHITQKHERRKWRQIAYENAARFMTFPCSFKNEGCDLIIHWNKILDHETGCSNGSMACPVSTSAEYVKLTCFWKGNVEEVGKHIEEDHKELMLDTPHFEELPPASKIYFTRINTILVAIILLKQNDGKYFCCVLINSSDVNSQYYRYQLELRDESKENSIILRKNRLEPLGNLQASLVNKEKLLEINVDTIGPMINQNLGTWWKISLKIGIVMKSKKEMIQVAEANGVKLDKFKKGTENSIKNSLPDDNILSELECPVCNEFMIPPIYICSNGHSLCCECLEKVQSCPNCRSSLDQKIRNFTLEKLTTKVRYPCKHREIGCGISTTSDKIRDHEKICDLTENSCLLNCGEKFRKPALYNHINEFHSENIIKLNVIYTREINDRKEQHFAVYAFGEIFRLSMRGGISTAYKFNLQHMRKDHQNPCYRYKVEIVDTSDLELNVTITSLVQPLTDNPTKTNSVAIPWELIKPALNDNKTFCFRINMSVTKRN